jgi:hypothetical protein
VEIGGRPDQLLGDTEAEGEILQILRSCHHDDMGDSVVHDGDGSFLRDRFDSLGDLARLPASSGKLQQGLGVPQAQEA